MKTCILAVTLVAFAVAVTAQDQAQAPAPGPDAFGHFGGLPTGTLPAGGPLIGPNGQPLPTMPGAGIVPGPLAGPGGVGAIGAGAVGAAGPHAAPAGVPATQSGAPPASPVASNSTNPPPTNGTSSVQNPPPRTTSAPIVAPTVAFVSRLPIDNPNTFANGYPTVNGVTSNRTYAQSWCDNLERQFPGSLCTAYATAGSVNVQTTMTFPVSASNPNAAAQASQQASQLQTQLQQIATNPAAAASLFPPSLGVGSVTVSGISVTGSFTAAAPAPVPMMAPRRATARTISFTTRLTTYGQPSDFNSTVQMRWCAKLTQSYPTAVCSVTGIFPGSVVVDSAMGFPAGDNSSTQLLQQLQGIANGNGQANALFGTDFGPVAVTSVADSNSTPAQTASTPAPPPPSSHHLSGGKIAGAVIGSVVGAALLAGCGYGGYKYYKSRRSYSPATMA